MLLRLDEALDRVARDGALVTLDRVPRLVTRRKRKHGVGHKRRLAHNLQSRFRVSGFQGLGFKL